MSTERIRGNLSTQSRLSGNLYRSGGGGSTVTIDPVYNSGVKIADYEINGEAGEIYIPNNEITIETLYTSTQRENTITLTQGMSNFDYILMVCYSTAGTGYLNSALIPVSNISVNNHIGVSDDTNYLWYIKASDISLTIEGTQGGYYVKEIQGIKFGGH